MCSTRPSCKSSWATQACRYLAAGDTERGSAIGQVVFRTLQDRGNPWREPQRIVVESCMMLLTGTLADHAEQLAARAARPDHPSVPRLAAPAAALAFTLRGDLEQAREIASDWFAPPPWSWARPQAIIFWAQVAAALGLPDPRWLYDRLAPHSGELAIVGVAGDSEAPSTACWPGSPGASADPTRRPPSPRPASRWKPGSARPADFDHARSGHKTITSLRQVRTSRAPPARFSRLLQ
jgi:hypothetical protein